MPNSFGQRRLRRRLLRLPNQCGDDVRKIEALSLSLQVLKSVNTTLGCSLCMEIVLTRIDGTLPWNSCYVSFRRSATPTEMGHFTPLVWLTMPYMRMSKRFCIFLRCFFLMIQFSTGTFVEYQSCWRLSANFNVCARKCKFSVFTSLIKLFIEICKTFLAFGLKWKRFRCSDEESNKCGIAYIHERSLAPMTSSPTVNWAQTTLNVHCSMCAD